MALEDAWLALELIKPIGAFIIGMTIYALFVFKFYRYVAKKDVLELDLTRYNYMSHAVLHKAMHFFLWLAAYVLLMPVLIFFWFIVLAGLLTFLSKGSNIETILLVALALVGTVRVTSYYSEDLSKDLAKMLPFALLGVYLVDISFFSFTESFVLIQTIPSHWQSMTVYFVFVVALEFVLRLVDILAPRPVKALDPDER